MPSWLTKAKAAFKSPEPKPPEPFRMVCVCGEILDGVRGEREQRLTCSRCGYEMFVLPESVYPAPDLPSSPLRKKIVPPQKRKAEAPAEEETAENAGPADEIKLAPPQQKTAEPEKRSPGVESQTIDVDHLRGIRDLRPASRKIITPFRLLLIGIIVVVSITGYAVVHSRNLDRAQLVLAEESKLGRAALDEENLFMALEHFDKVNDALTTLGSNNEESRELRQLYWEVRAGNELTPNSLHEMLSEASSSYDKENPSAWEDLFEFTYNGKWVVLETKLPETQASPEEIRIAIPVIMPGQTAQIAITGDKISGWELNETPEKIIFAGRIESCLPGEENGTTWVIRLDAESVFLWSNPQTYHLLGFLPDEKTNQILTEQSRYAGGGL